MRGPLLLRSTTSYAGPFTALGATGTALGAATVLGVSLTDAAGARVGTVLPVLVLALVVVPVPATDLARRLRSRTALARVRGADVTRVLLATAGPAVVAVVLGGLVGVGAAVAATGALPAAWDTPATPPPTALVWAAGSTTAAAVLAAGCARLVTREPLAAALRPPVRTRPPGPWAMVGGAAVAVLAAASVYLSRSADSPAAAGVVVLAGSGLLGLAAGVLVVRLLAAASPLVEGRRSPGVLLGLRRATAVSQAGRVRAVCATGVVVVAALSATLSAGAWADRSERVRIGAPLQVTLPDASALEALRLTQRLDPEGRWLMAGAVTDDRTEATLRTTWLDLARFDRVAGDYLDGTPVRVADAVASLTDAEPVALVSGEQVTAVTDRRATLDLALLGTDGTVTRATVRPTGTTEVPCADGCVVLTITSSTRTEVTGLDLGGTDLLDAAWTTADGAAGPPGPLTLDGVATLAPAVSVAAVPVLTAGSPDWDDVPVVVGIAGDDRPATPVGTRGALPLVGGAGVLADLPVALAAAGAQGAAVRSVVLARDDTPAAVLAGLADAGAGTPLRAGGEADALGATAAAELHVRRLLTPAAALLGTLAVLAGARRRRRAVAHDHAALRLVGLAPHHLRTAAVVEATVLGGAAVLAVATVGLVACVTVVEGAGVVPTGATLLDPGPVVAPLAVLVGALGAGAVLLVATLGASWPRGSGSEPAVLLAEGTEATS